MRVWVGLGGRGDRAGPRDPQTVAPSMHPQLVCPKFCLLVLSAPPTRRSRCLAESVHEYCETNYGGLPRAVLRPADRQGERMAHPNRRELHRRLRLRLYLLRDADGRALRGVEVDGWCRSHRRVLRLRRGHARAAAAAASPRSPSRCTPRSPSPYSPRFPSLRSPTSRKLHRLFAIDARWLDLLGRAHIMARCAQRRVHMRGLPRSHDRDQRVLVRSLRQ